MLAGRRGRYRRTMNDTDNDASTKALDSLLNYETVKYFNNEAHEAQRYDRALARYERAAVRVQVSLNMLNLGQAAIIAIGLTLIMLLAAAGMRDGTMTVGKFVVVNTYLMQLYQPLNFLGVVYMTIKQGLVDMEQMFPCCASTQEVTDKPGAPRPDGASVGGFRRRGRFSKMSISATSPKRTILKGIDFDRSRRRQAGDRRAQPVPANPPSAGCCSVSMT